MSPISFSELGPVPGAGRGAGRPDSPPFRTHRAQFRQWAQDKAIHVATGRELEQRMADRNLRQQLALIYKANCSQFIDLR